MATELTPPYRAIAERLQVGEVIPFLGAGASLGTRDPKKNKWDGPLKRFAPTGNELAKYIAKMVEFPDSEKEPGLAKVAQYAEIAVGRDPLDQALRGIFEKCTRPARVHRIIAKIDKPMVIVSTNYDDLLERSLAGRPFDLVIHALKRNGGELYWRAHGESQPVRVSPKRLDIDLSRRTVVYKMHGSLDRDDLHRDQFVITEDDYIEFLTRMSRRDAVPHIFAEPFSKYAFLFLGYGLNDWNLRVVLNRIERDSRKGKIKRGSGKGKDVTSWAIQHPLSSLERRFWQDRNVEVYDVTIEDFITELEKRMN